VTGDERDENAAIDAEIVDHDRALEMQRIADDAIYELDVDRWLDEERIEHAIARQLADLERESNL
jgi:hypothetical protein